MIITIIVFIGTHFTRGHIKDLIDNICQVDYPMSHIEIILVSTWGVQTGDRIVRRNPLIRIIHMNGEVLLGQCSNRLVCSALGEVIVFSVVDGRFKKDTFKKELWSAMSGSGKGIYLCKDWFAVKKGEVDFPDDVFCIRTYSILKAIVDQKVIVGDWGKLNRKEILRFAYKIWDLPLRQKVSLAMKFISA